MTLRVASVSSVLALLAAVSHAQNQGVILNAGPHSLGYGVQVVNGVSTGPLALPTITSPASPVIGNFNVGDGLNLVSRVRHLKSANWYYRVAGDTRERTPANLSLTSISSTRVEFRFEAVGSGGTVVPGLFGLMEISLFDQGPNAAICSWNLCFENQTTNMSYAVSSFFALDADLNGTPLGDVSLPVDPSAGRRLTFQDGSTTGVLYSPKAIGSGQGAVPLTVGAMVNSMPNSFSPDVNPSGTNGLADNAWLVEHFCLVQPGGQECQPIYFGIGLNGQVPEVVPEPTSMVVLGLGLVGIFRRRKKG